METRTHMEPELLRKKSSMERSLNALIYCRLLGLQLVEVHRCQHLSTAGAYLINKKLIFPSISIEVQKKLDREIWCDLVAALLTLQLLEYKHLAFSFPN